MTVRLSMLVLGLIATLAVRPILAQERGWRPAIGVTAGYARVHFQGFPFNFSTVAAPGLGSSFVDVPFVGTAPVATPATVFVIIPLGSKLALEPGLDVHRTQSEGETAFNGHLAVRLNYAVSGGWYAAAGGNLRVIKLTGEDGFGVAGAQLAWGYRFHLAGDAGGRFEASYTMFKEHGTLGLPPTTTLALLFALTMPLD